MIPIWLLSGARVAWDLWNRIPGVIKAIIIMFIVAFVAFKMGEHKQIRICNQQKQESINEAKRIDREASEAAQKRMELQNEQYRLQALEAENQLNKAKDYYATLPSNCQIDSDFIERNNGIGLGNRLSDPVPSDKKRTPGRK